MKTKFLKRIYSVFAIVLLALIAVGCSNSEPNTERQAAKEAVESLLSMNFADTDENGVVYDKVKKSIGIVEDGDGIVSEEDLANGSYSEFFGDITATFTSSNPDVMKTEWTYSYRRDFEYAEDGKTVIGIKKVLVRTLNFVVNRQDEDTKVEITMTATKPYEVNGVEYKYTKSRSYVFTVAAKEALGDVVELTIGELNDRIISYAKETSWDNYIKTGLVNENGEKYEVQFQGIVTEVLWNDALDIHSFMVSDGDDSFYVYEPSEITGGGSIEIGDLVVVRCIPTGYFSIIESEKKSAVVEILSHANEVPAAKEYTVDEWYTAFPNGKEFYNCPGQRVKIQGVLQHNGSKYLLKSEDSSKDFEIYYKGYTAYEESILKANLGKKVKIEASIYDYHSSGYYRLLANIYDYPMEVVVLEGQEALDADASTITTEFKVKEGGSITLPTTFPNGSTISAWVADKEGYIDLETLVCTLGETKEDTVVKLTATLSNGEFSKEIIVTVTLDYVAPVQKEYVLADKLEVGVAYKYVVNQTNVGKVLYFAGAMDDQGKYFASTEDSNEAVDVYLEAAEGGYYMYFLNEGVKTYMNMVSDGSKLCLEAAPSNVWVQNDKHNTFFTTVAETEYYVGMYSTFETFSRSKTSYLANSGQCPARFYVEKGTQGGESESTSSGIKEALEAAEGTEVVIEGTVSSIYYEWSDQYSNMSFYVTDGTNTILAFRCGTKVVVGDKVKVTGKVTAYNGVNQLAQGCTAEILPAEEPEVPTHEHVECPECGKCTAEDCTGAEEEKCAGHEAVKVEYTIPEAIAAADGTAVVVKGKVKSVDIEWSTQYSNMSVTLVDEQGNTLYIFRLATLVALYDEVTITGTVGSFNGAKQIAAGATAEITKVHEHEYVEGVCECGTKDPDYVPDVTVEYELLTKVGFESYTSSTNAKESVEENGITFTTNSVKRMYTDNTPGSVSLKFNNSSSSNAGFEATGFAQAISKITFKAATWNSNVTFTFVGTTADGQTITQTVIVSNTAKEFASEEFEVVFKTPVLSFTFAASQRAFIDDISFYTVAAQEAPHEHVFVEGKCECGEEDPNYVPPHVHVACPECQKCTAEDCTGAEEEKCAGHESESTELKVTFDDTSKRTSVDGEHQTWQENGVTVTVNKNTSSSSINANYYNPLRVYKNHELVVSYEVAFTTVVIDVYCANNTATYIDAFTATTMPEGVTVTNVDGLFTLVFATPVTSFSIVMDNAQVRLNSVEIIG